MRKFPPTTRPGMGSRLAIPGSVSWGGLMYETLAGMISAFPHARKGTAFTGPRPLSSVAQADAEVARRLHRVGVERDGLHRRDRFLHLDGHHVRRNVGDDVAELSLLDHAHGRRAEAQRQQTVTVRGAAAALQVAEHQRPHLE